MLRRGAAQRGVPPTYYTPLPVPFGNPLVPDTPFNPASDLHPLRPCPDLDATFLPSSFLLLKTLGLIEPFVLRELQANSCVSTLEQNIRIAWFAWSSWLGKTVGRPRR